MKNTLKKLSIALIFVVTIVLGYSPSYAIETSTNIPKCASCDVNLPQEALIGLCEKNSVYNDVPVLTTDEEIIDYIRGKMVNREEYIRVCTGNRQVGFDSNRNNVVVSYVKQAFEHTGNPVEGDYIESTW